MPDPATETLFASVLPKGESAQSRGLRWAGFALLATAVVSGTRLMFAPQLAGTGIYWWISALFAVMDILLGVSLAMRSERFVLFVMVWAVAGMLFDVVLGLRTDSAAFLIEGVCFNGGILLLLAGYPRAWRLALGLVAVAGPLALQLYVVGGAAWTQIRRISFAIQATTHMKPVAEPTLHSARGYSLRVDPATWRVRDLAALSPAQRGEVDLWLAHASGAQLAIHAVKRDRLAMQPLDELRAELLAGFPEPLGTLAANGQQWLDYRSKMTLRRTAAEQSEMKLLGQPVFAHVELHVDGDVGLGVVAFVPRAALALGNPALFEALNTLHIDTPAGQHFDAAAVDSIGKSISGSLARMGLSGETATGIVVSSDSWSALAVTTADFVGDTRHVELNYNNGVGSPAAVGAKIVRVDRERNLALVSFPSMHHPPPVALSSTALSNGAPVAVVGFPVRAKPVPVPIAVEATFSPPAQGDAPPTLSGALDERGLSGGPVVDRDGNVLGIAVLRPGQPATFVGADAIRAFIGEDVVKGP